ncbi:MAG: T9SS type A sorting domain-containing protein [Cyclobacteriaceae bacterium]
MRNSSERSIRSYYLLKQILGGIVCIVLIATKMDAQTNSRRLGVNLTDLSPFGTQWIYTNALKQSSGWLIRNLDDETDPIKSSTELRVELSSAFDGQGYPLSVPFAFDHSETQGKNLGVSCLVLNGQPDPYYYPSGNYLLVFEGSGTIVIQGDVDGEARVFSSAGEHEVSITSPTSLGLEIIILESNVENPIQNVQLIFPEYVNNYVEVKFQPSFIDLIQNFEVARFMKPARSENNTIEHWEDRTTSDHFSYFMDTENDILIGMPYEDIAELCNLAGVNPWINVPYRINDAYARSLSQLLHSAMNEERKLHLEYSNEAWNPSYPQTRAYMLEQGMLLNLATSENEEVAEFEAVHRFYTKRMLEIFDIFEEVWTEEDRFVKIHASQSEGYTADLVFEAYDLESVNPDGKLPDAVAIASYIGVTLFDDFASNGLDVCSHSPEDLLDTLRSRVDQEMRSMIEAWSEKAQARGISLYAYEGGQHVTEINFQPMEECAAARVAEMNRLPEMADFFCQVFENWYEAYNGDLFMVFNLMEGPDDFGSFGILESQWQETNLSAKWKGIDKCVWRDNDELSSDLFNQDILVYPNPAHDYIRLTLDEDDINYQIIDMLGRIVKKGLLDRSRDNISIEKLAEGTYVLNVYSPSSGNKWQSRFLKKKKIN